MAKLLQKRDGNHYTKRYIHGARAITTWQITRPGVAILKHYGISVDDEIPNWLLDELKAQQLIYTGRGGVQTDDVVASEGAPTPPWKELLHLVCDVDEKRWSTALVLPELPSTLLTAIASDTWPEVLGKCGFTIDSGNPIPAISLWPGKGGERYQVMPRENFYILQPTGTWPDALAEWSRSLCPSGVQGLRPQGTLFTDEESGAVRVQAGMSIVTGTSYTIVVHNDWARAGTSGGTWPFPTSVQRQPLGICDQWVAWTFYLPDSADDDVRNWCVRLGHPLIEYPWRLTLVSPPPLRYLASGLPVLQTGREAIIEARSASLNPDLPPPQFLVKHADADVLRVPAHIEDDTQPSNKGMLPAHYFALSLEQGGGYQVWAEGNRASVLSFLTDPEELLNSTSFSLLPRPLEARVVQDSTSPYLNALVDGSGPYEIVLPYPKQDEPPIVEAWCPIPLDVRWTCGATRGHHRCLDEGVMDVLAGSLEAALTADQVFILELDAGTFGVLRFHLRFDHRQLHGTNIIRESPVEILQRALWLATAIPTLTLQPGMVVVTVPYSILQPLRALQSWPSVKQLASITRVPRPLVPQLRALAEMLARPEPGHADLN